MQQPVRRPEKRRASSCTTGVLPLTGQGSGSLSFEGRLDFDFQRIMTVAPHVHRYQEQPETFRLLIDGQPRRYTPDGLAFTSFGRIYFEVKPKLLLARSPDLDGKLSAIEAECRRRNAGFHIVTEDHIRVGSLLRNSTAVWSAAQGLDRSDVQQTCCLLRSIAFPATMSQLSDVLGQRRWPLIKGLVGLRYLATDLSKPFSEITVITKGGRDW